MEIEEDEDVVFKDDPLDQYLKEIGFQDYETAIRTNENKFQNVSGRQSFARWITSLWHGMDLKQYFSSKTWRINWLDSTTCHEIINLITHSKLLIPEDFHFISSLNENTKLIQRPSYCMLSLGGTVNAVSCTLGSPFAIVSVPVVMLYAVLQWTCQRYRKHGLQIVSSFVEVLRDLKSTSRKVLRHLQENELIARGFMFTVTGSSVERLENSSLPSFAQRWHTHPGLRKGLASALTAASHCLIEATKTLQQEYPLRGNLEKQLTYLALQENGYFEEISPVLHAEDITTGEVKIEFLKVLQNYYLLLQSEFLQRLTLIFNQDLRVDTTSVKWNILTDISSKMTKIVAQLSTEYRVFNCYGLPGTEKTSNTFNNIKKSKLKYDKLFLSVHSTKMHLQNILYRTHSIEEYLEACENIANDNKQTIEDDLHSAFCDILKEIDMCKSCCEQGETFLKNLKKSDVLENLSENESQTTKNHIIDQNVIQIPVGQTDLDPHGEDEVFEAISTAEYFADSDDSFEDIKNNKTVKYPDCSNLLLSELKTVLVDKAKEWRVREERALENKRSKGNIVEMEKDCNLTDTLKEISLSHEINNLLQDNLTGNLQSDKNYTVLKESPDKETVKDCDIREEVNSTDAEGGTHTNDLETSFHLNNTCESKVQISSPFGLQAVPLSHRFMLKNTETFCGTGENSSDDDSIGDLTD